MTKLTIFCHLIEITSNYCLAIFATMNKETVLIVQPALPHYRVKLFDLVQQLLPNLSIHIFATNLDHNGVLSTRPADTSFNYSITPNSVTHFGVCWHPKAVKKILSLKKEDTLVLVGNPRYLFNMVAACIAKLRGVDVIWWGQLWSLNTSKRSLRLKIGFMNLVSTKILLYTKREATLLSHLRPNRPIFYLNNGIDNTEIINHRVSFKAQERPQRILLLGRLTPKANLTLLLRALPKTESIVVDVIGGFPTHEILQLIATSNLQNRIIFHGQLHNELEIAKIANNCLFFVYPGTVGLSLIHAFNYGLPALVHNQRRKHMPEIAAFKAGYNGETFEYGDHISLSEALTRMAESTSQLNYYSQNALKVSAEDYNTDVMAKRLAAAIKSGKP
jgi:glycosyltransferase involved in cell wall biosynthesis